MKKTILALAFVSTLAFVSCKESTEEKIEDATEAVGADVETATENAVDAIDSTTTEIGNDMKDGAEKMKEAVK
jgi:vacuolar-type H+-ATPase subunit E/Vma4